MAARSGHWVRRPERQLKTGLRRSTAAGECRRQPTAFTYQGTSGCLVYVLDRSLTVDQWRIAFSDESSPTAAPASIMTCRCADRPLFTGGALRIAAVRAPPRPDGRARKVAVERSG